MNSDDEKYRDGLTEQEFADRWDWMDGQPIISFLIGRDAEDGPDHWIAQELRQEAYKLFAREWKGEEAGELLQRRKKMRRNSF